MFDTIPGEIGAGESDRMQTTLPYPATFDDIVQSTAPGNNLPLGRNEAAMALESRLHVTQEGTQIQAVNVTDEIAISWKRFLCNTMNNKKIIAGGISAVYAVRPLDGADPQLLFFHPDTTYTFFPKAEDACQA